MSAGNARTFPFVLQFGCGVSASGTLFVTVNTTDRNGTANATRLGVAIVGD
jgi:hypothetical protein